MKNIIFILTVFIISSCSCNINSISKFSSGEKGNGKITSKEISISDYSVIEAGGSANLIYEQKNSSPYLRIEIDENLHEYISVKVNGNTLSIRQEQNINSSQYTIYTNSKTISEIKKSGAGNITLKGRVDTKNLTITVSGSGNIIGENLHCQDLTTRISGSGKIDVNGKCEFYNMAISGSGSAKAYNMEAKNVSCKISGSGNAEVYASESLEAKVSGSGNIRYAGSPKHKDISVSGSGKVKERD